MSGGAMLVPDFHTSALVQAQVRVRTFQTLRRTPPPSAPAVQRGDTPPVTNLQGRFSTDLTEAVSATRRPRDVRSVGKEVGHGCGSRVFAGDGGDGCRC